MGRWPGSGKITVEECLSISIFRLARKGCLSGLKMGALSWTDTYGMGSKIGMAINIDEKGLKENFMLLFYTQTDNYTGEETKLEYKVDITTTPCNLGGIRYWFICPIKKNWWSCGRRVAKLYLPRGAKYFGCRHCYDLTYRSCQEHDKRVDALVKDPERISAMMRGDIRRLPLALKACEKYLLKGG